MTSTRMRSIARRIAKLEVALSPQYEPEYWPDRRGRTSRAPFHPTLRLRFGNLRCLPPDYQGERHVVIAKRLPDQGDQEWVEFEEVPGPAPSEPPQDPRLKWLDVVFVGSKSGEGPD